MRRSLTIAIPQPCHESWAAMTPTAQGRHCAACQKTVVDFSRMSDAEVLAYLSKAGQGSTCGRFAENQLQRPLQPLALAPAQRWRTWAATLAALLGLRELLSLDARAQQVPVEQTARKPIDMKRNWREQEARPVERISVIRGQVVEGTQSLPGVTVLIPGTQVGISTGLDGCFELILPAEYQNQDSVSLEFKYIGYASQLRTTPLTIGEQVLRVELHADVKGELAGEIVIIGAWGYRAMPPAPWRPRALYGWAKYWVTRPFRSY
ncbi:hypothetical protein GCM10023185_02770 [Hymenobacter saemangeumensis]|uniref:Carboxypeptidase-like regulatory domain-containing protein n=1 Tax=Hymenobacter saemangeumensis TaxID=1084522 RepID=A0ABP8HYT7_9BACT